MVWFTALSKFYILNFSFGDSAKILDEYKMQILFRSKNEEEKYNLLKKEIQPINKKIQLIINILNEKQKKLSLIEINLNKMEQIMNNYIKMKNDYFKDCKSLKLLFGMIEVIIKTLKLFKNNDYAYDYGNIKKYKDIGFGKNLEHLKDCLKESKKIIDNNEKVINNLNDYDNQFNFSKITVLKYIKEIMSNKNDFFPVEIIKNLIKPELFKYFNKISNEAKNDDTLNNFQLLYNDNEKIKIIFLNYEQIYKLLDQNISVNYTI